MAGVGAGVLGALALALLAQHISEWLDGLGQDVVNIGVLVAGTDDAAVALHLGHDAHP